ncbi:hypothetical protein BDV95DRAFT_479193 [Massariosphaeria phaeospora]|uniref:Uncharacterized protein n=1 Tax=Massariosphaeria phaeospora TaxID=100035 RepID=A0A7C8MIF5_9PLEO|nr:hypothetical protein BDV95DRAFT_479193 [Massariosphaeria phaeospora]
MLFDLLVLSVAVLLNGRTAKAQSDGTPCQSVSSMSAAYVSLFPSATQALVPAQAAEDCLKSVPIDKEEDLALLEEMRFYINWQSNLAYLVDPPEGYTEERVDTLEEIQKITDKLKNDEYEDEYTLMSDISAVLTKSYDFHFSFSADIADVFAFRRGNVGRGLLDEFALISVSSDGKELPKLYNYYDIMVEKDAEKEGWKPSPVTQINNQSAEDYIQEWSKRFVFHEDHARYNALFPNQASISMGRRGNLFGRSDFPDGEHTTVEHENKTVNTFINNAIVPLDSFDDIEDGESFFARFCNQGPPKTEGNSKLKRATPTKPKRQEAEPTATNYPAPAVLHSEAIIGGYYLSGQGYEDVAVLSVPSFSSGTEEGPAEFQDLIGGFLKDAKDKGRKRLVIDLRGNTGGFVFLGYDLFKQLFPSEDPYGASQYRANEAFDITGQFLTTVLENATYEDALNEFKSAGLESNLVSLYKSMFNYKLYLTTDNKNFTSWEEYFGPHVHNNDNFTTVSRVDLNNFFSDDLSLDVTGYRTRADKLNKEQPFEADKIVLLQDGACGSTCAVFAEFMKSQGSVHQVVVGGTPKTGPMQGVAGSKGSQTYTWTQVQEEAVLAYTNMPDHQEELNGTELGSLVFADRPLMRSAYQSSGRTRSSVNLRDNIRIGDDTSTPLEFVYEAADCRVFYTAEMVRDVEATWKKTVDAKWGDANKFCVEGSVAHKSSLSGGAEIKNDKDKKGAAASKGVDGGLVAAVVGIVGMLLML